MCVSMRYRVDFAIIGFAIWPDLPEAQLLNYAIKKLSYGSFLLSIFVH